MLTLSRPHLPCYCCKHSSHRPTLDLFNMVLPLHLLTPTTNMLHENLQPLSRNGPSNSTPPTGVQIACSHVQSQLPWLQLDAPSLPRTTQASYHCT